VKSNSQMRYQRRLEKLIDYIWENLDQPLDLNQMADVANISPYHLHRIYQGIFGENLVATVKRLRLHHAAGQLTNSALSVKEIAAHSGYSSVPSFSRAFSEVYGMPPARYRSEGSHRLFNMEFIPSLTGENTMHDVRIETIAEIHLMGLKHTGDYMGIGQSFERIFGWLGMRGLQDNQMRSIGIYYDDPGSVPEHELRSVACAEFPALAETALEEPFEPVSIAGGEYAVLRFKGAYANLQSAYQWFYGQWLPQSGREVSDRPCFEDYLNNPREVSPEALLTDIYMPLKPE